MHPCESSSAGPVELGGAPSNGRREATTVGAVAGSLDLHEGISHPDPREAAVGGCLRWPKSLRLVSSAGDFVMGRCRATNLCDYCAKLSAVEWAAMLAYDGMTGEPPALWMVLTTRSTSAEPSRYYRSREVIVRAIRRRWPRARWLCITEFSTGYGPRSGGARRPHFNVMLKGVPVDQAQELERLVRSIWCSREDAAPEAQFVGEVAEVGGLMRYLALHFLKESQRPPQGWKGHRVTFSRGYFTEPVWKVRKAAQESLRLDRAVYRAELDGYEGESALREAQLRREQERRKRWELVELSADELGLVKARPLHGGSVGVLVGRRSDTAFLQRERFNAELLLWDRGELVAEVGRSAGGANHPPGMPRGSAESTVAGAPPPPSEALLCAAAPSGYAAGVSSTTRRRGSPL
jgi:hypothetical protein